MCSFIRILTLAIALTIVLSPTAVGGLVDEHSWTVVSDDGRFRVVMLQLEPKRFDTDDVQGIELKKKFSQSGVYAHDKSTDSFLWPIPYHPPVYYVSVAPDGNHVLLAITDTDHSISNVPPGAALNFYHKDRERDYWPEHEVAWGYFLKMLVNKLLGRSPWNEWKDAAYDPSAGTFTIKTNQAEEFVFDIRSGKKIRTTSAWNLGLAIYLAIVPLLIYGFGHLGLLKSRADWHPVFWQVSLGEILLLATVASVLLALLRYSTALSVAVAVVGLVGSAIAHFLSRGRLSWWTGSFLAVYGTVVGLLVFSTLGETLIWQFSRLQNSFAVVAMLVGSAVIGGVGGALGGGWIARKRENVKA